MEFNPAHPIVKQCLLAMTLEEEHKHEAAGLVLQDAWNAAQEDFEKFLVAYYLTRLQQKAADRLHWANTALDYALRINDNSVRSAYPALYRSVAECYQALGDTAQAQKHHKLSLSCSDVITDKGPFYHGTRAKLEIGALLTAGYHSNYQAEVVMNHIYFTAIVNGAGLAAALAKGTDRERVYIVEPTGSFENDPNVTDKKFPGNPTRSYRSLSPLKVIGELSEWERLPPDALQQWKEKLAKNKGDIIN